MRPLGEVLPSTGCHFGCARLIGAAAAGRAAWPAAVLSCWRSCGRGPGQHGQRVVDEEDTTDGRCVVAAVPHVEIRSMMQFCRPDRDAFKMG